MKENRLNITLDDTQILKGIAIIAMIIYHTISGYFGAIFQFCVAMYVFLSGYGLSIKYNKLINVNNEGGGF